MISWGLTLPPPVGGVMAWARAGPGPGPGPGPARARPGPKIFYVDLVLGGCFAPYLGCLGEP